MTKKGESVAQLDKGSLKRVLGVSDLFAIGYGDLGSSIYYALGITALYALGATPIALGLAGIVFICTALTYAELASTFHESGGSASYARHAFNDLISFIAGWGLLLDYIVTIAISAFAVGPYLSYFIPDLKITGVQIGFSISLIGILFVVNSFGVHQSTRVSFALAGLTILIQAAVVVVGALFLLNMPTIIDHLRIGVANVDWSPTWPEFWKGTAMAMVAYTGIESIAQLGSEAKKPSKSIPRAILITMCILVFMYLGISLVALSAMPAKVLGTQYVQDPIAGIVTFFPIGGHVLSPLVGLMAAALLFVASNAGLIGSSRLSFNMGQYYQLPRFFYSVHPKYRTPIASLAFFGILAALVIFFSKGQMTFLADLYNFGAMIAFFFAHLSLIVLRVKKPELKRPFRIGLNIPFGKSSIPITAIVGLFATAAVWVLVVLTKVEGRDLGFAWMALGLLMYFVYRRKKKIAAMGQLAIEKIKMPAYKPLKIHHILVPIRGEMETEALQMACELAKLHNAKLTAVNILEVPPSLPLDSDMTSRLVVAQAVLKRAEAISREFNFEVATEVIRARNFAEAVIDLVRVGQFDLLVLETAKGEKKRKKETSSAQARILKEVPCRIYICTSAMKGRHDLLLPSQR